jgi:hypothetical protein
MSLECLFSILPSAWSSAHARLHIAFGNPASAA